MFTLVYLMLFLLFLYLLNKKIQHGPDVHDDQDETTSRMSPSLSPILNE
jgi:cytochrome d ubiquinol oxidase subunit I